MLSNKIFMHNIQIVFVCFILALNCLSFGQYLYEKCESSDGIDGFCEYTANCAKAVRSIEENRTHYFKRCGFEKTTEIICCPLDSITSTPLSGSTTAGVSYPLVINGKPYYANEERVEMTEPTKSFDVDPFIIPKEEGKKDKKTTLSDVTPSVKDHDRSRYDASLSKSEKACRTYEKNFAGHLTTLIIGGNIAEENEFPHMAAIKMSDGSKVKTVCGGSLISKRHILTVAHCLMGGAGHVPVAVQLGTLNDSDVSNLNVTMYGIDSFYAHPEYSRRSKYHDIAIIKLDRDVILMDPINYIYPACLNTNSSYPSPNDKLFITGWGLTSEEKTSDILMKAKVDIISMEDCEKVFKINRGLRDGLSAGQMCAGGKGADTCNGDSGGPLQSQQPSNSGVYRITGLTSFGYICGYGLPGVYTRVSHYLSWIESVVWPDEKL